MNKNRSFCLIAIFCMILCQPLAFSQYARFSSCKNMMHRQSRYIFISFSMPLSLIASYVQEASLIGATLVLKGVNPDSSLKDFLMKNMLPLLKDKSTSPEIIIDPRLFNRFSIYMVPTFVGVFPVKKPKHSLAYIKLSGAVKARWAFDKLNALCSEHLSSLEGEGDKL